MVEAMGAGSAVIAHDNHFNRWVAGEDAQYFGDFSECEKIFDKMLALDEGSVSRMKDSSLSVFNEKFTWGQVLGDYEALLNTHYPVK